MAHTFIEQIEPGQAVDDIFLVKEPILRSTTRGDLYIAMYLCDRTGQLNTKDTDKLFKEVKDILSRIKNSQLKALVDEFLADDELMKKFKTAPAAMRVHHNYLGGLLEHTHNTLNVAVAILPFYPQVQDELVIAAIFLHDIGKTEELTYDISFSYTNTGQLLGHIAQALLMIKQKADCLEDKGKKIEKNTMDSLNHIILSHHGRYEFGSPKLPATPEAFMVNYIDDLDAKINQVTAAIDGENPDSDWTSWQKTLETKLYRKRIEQ